MPLEHGFISVLSDSSLHWRMVRVREYKGKKNLKTERTWCTFSKETENYGCGDLVYLFKPLLVYLNKKRDS